MASESTKPILITGATGKQGGSVLKQLASHHSSKQFTLLAVTRNATSSSAKKLVERYPNTLLVQGDLDRVPELFDAATAALKAAGKDIPIWGIYSVQVAIGGGASPDSELKQATALIDESVKRGVKHFVQSSVDRGGNEKSFDDPTPVPHFISKHKVEQHLLSKAGKQGENMGWTILRPVAFMDNLEPNFPTKVFITAMRNSVKDKPVQWVSVEDIGMFAARAFREPEQWNARAEGLAGDELTFEEMSAAFERVTGSPAPTSFGVLGGALMWAVKEMGLMLKWFHTDGYGVDIQKLKQIYPDICDFERWLRERSAFPKK